MQAIVSCIVAMFVFHAAPFVFADETLYEDLIAHWSFDYCGKATAVQDLTENGYTGIIKGHPTCGSDRGGDYFIFTGKDCVIYPDAVFGPSENAFTVFVRVEVSDIKAADNPHGQQQIIYKGPRNGEFQFVFLNSGEVSFGVKLKDGHWYDVRSPVQGKVLYNITATYLRGDKIELWLNGRKVSQRRVPRLDLFVTSGFKSSIGAYNGSSRYLKGKVDDIRIYTRRLNPGEIQRLGQTFLH